MDSNINHLNSELSSDLENDALDQSSIVKSKNKTNRIIIVIEDGRVVKYIQKTVNKN